MIAFFIAHLLKTETLLKRISQRSIFSKAISRPVWILSLVSLLTDVSSEMLYPVMPIYLKSIGFSIVLIGVLEGVAEATAGLSKGYFGKQSDLKGKRLPFVQLGYFLSALSKPMMAVFTFPVWVFSARTLDRLGKGVRTGARDALLSDAATPQTKATVFGFHRALDTLGAAIGPLLALLFLAAYPGAYRTLFFIAFAPGLLGVLTTFLLKESRRAPTAKTSGTSFLGFVRYIPQSSPAYRKLLLGLLVFALFNSSDVFLLLMFKQQGVSDTNLISIYIFYNLVYALLAYPAGILADRLGLKKIFLTGLCFFVMVYIGMAYNKQLGVYYLLFFLYGAYAACTEGVSKAWISKVCDPRDTATAIGTYEGLRSIAALSASAIAGLLWYYINPMATFLTTATAVAAVILYFAKMRKTEDGSQKTEDGS